MPEEDVTYDPSEDGGWGGGVSGLSEGLFKVQLHHVCEEFKVWAGESKQEAASHTWL